MIKYLIIFIIIGLSKIAFCSLTSNMGIKNSYLNDKISYNDKKPQNPFKEKISDINLYKLGAMYNIKTKKMFFETLLDLGIGSSNDSLFQYENFSSPFFKDYKSKEKIFDFLMKAGYLWRMGPLRFGPSFGFEYNLQKIRRDIDNLFSNNKISLQWYLPSIGIILNLQPIASRNWRLYSIYDFSYGRFKMRCILNNIVKTQAIRHKFILGTLFKIYKNWIGDLNFTYSHARSGFQEKNLRKLKRESFEGSVIIKYKF